MSLQRVLVLLALFMVFLAYAASLPIAFWSPTDEAQVPTNGSHHEGDTEEKLPSPTFIDYMLLVSGFGISLAVVVSHMQWALKRYTQGVHDLNPEDADGLFERMLFGSNSITSRSVMLRAQSGQVDLEGPPIVHKVGGPARLIVDHDTVVITSRLGVLQRILGPGRHRLKPCERVWKTVDMRPQRRSLTVQFITRDGIPASCQASIVCRIASSQEGEANGELSPRLGYSEQLLLDLITSENVRRQNGNERISDWVIDMVQGVLVSSVRTTMERYRLDEFLNPQYWLDEDEGPARTVSPPQLLTELESEIETAVRSQGQARGVVVERVELGMVRPDEVTISRQWLEFWQAKLQRNIDQYEMQVTTTHEQLAENARVEAQAMFVNRMLEEVQQLRSNNMQVPPQLIIASFMEVLHAMTDQGLGTQRLLFQQAESLIRIINALQRDESPFDSSTYNRRSS